MPLPDDHDEKWIYKEHTRAKHDVLHYYLTIWASKVSNKNYSLRIFDCFAGRGDYVSSDGPIGKPLDVIETDAKYPGSPLIMMDALSKHQNRFKTAECYFLEPKDHNRQILSDTLQGSKLPDNVNYHVREEAFPNGIDKVISESGGTQGFAFFFIDPFNIKYLDYDTICKIAKISDHTGGFETFITLMTSQLIRWQSSGSHHPGYNSLFGTPNWKVELTNYVPRFLETREAEYYCERLEKHGPKHTLAYMVTEGDSKRLKYHLVFTSNKEDGIELMKESMERCGTDYALAFAPKRPEISHQQVRIGQFNSGKLLDEEAMAKSYLLSKFAGQSLSFDEIVSKSVVERRYNQSLRQDYRKYIRELHDDGDIELPGWDGKGLSDDVEIFIPDENN